MSTPGAPECHAVPQGTKCGANRAHGRPGSRARPRGRPGQRPRTWAQGGAATEQVHGTYAKTATQRLSYCRWFWLLPPCSPNAKTPRFGIRNHPKHTTHELQNTAGTTPPSVMHTPWGPAWEFAGVVWEVACSSEKPEWAHDTAKTEASGGNGTWDAAGGHFHGTWPPRVARSYPPFVTQRNPPN
jgi:hypothetical protein